ncbi:hypothetical protein BBJ28_00013241, partial [Nothophytophthora sp. Chile5]
MMPWEAAKLPWVNASLFGVQALLTCVGLYLGDAGAVRAQHDTPLTPASYAFSIWNVVYLLTMIMLVTDISYVGLSLYDSAAKPNVLRLCFAASCVVNGAWCVAFGSGLVDVASVAVSVLWLTLLPLYVFASYERHVRPLVWHEYLCSELCVRLYFAWVTVETLISWTITLQGRVGGFLELATYLVLLSVVVVLALCGIMYGRDPVLALVVVWALVGVAVAIGVFLFAPEGAWAAPKAPAAADSGAAASSGSTTSAPPTAPAASTLAPTNPLAPPTYVLYIWVAIYAFTAATVITDRFFPRFSFY